MGSRQILANGDVLINEEIVLVGNLFVRTTLLFIHNGYIRCWFCVSNSSESSL